MPHTHIYSNANTRWLNRHTKKCPKCKSPIEKNNGCDHMTCKRQAGGCGHEFCWRCLAPWGPIIRRGGGNHHHRPTCYTCPGMALVPSNT